MNTLVLNSQNRSPGNPSTCALQTDQFGELNVIMPVGASMNLVDRNINVSSINGAAPGGAIPEDLGVNSLTASTINTSSVMLQGVWPAPLFQSGRFTMPVANSTIVETDITFSGTNWYASAVYDGAVQSAVSSIGTQVLSPSTFSLWAQGGLGVAWMALGN